MSASLYQQLHNRDNLMNAWRVINSKGSSGGIDGVSIEIFEEDFENNMQQLQEELQAGRFVPQPYKEVRIAKENREQRILGLMSIRDKIVQQVAKNLLEPILDKLFLNVSFAYRAGMGTRKAIERVHHLINDQKRQWLVNCDIDKYFDNINHDRLMSMLATRIEDKQFLGLLRVWLKMGRVDGSLKWTDSRVGIPQGGIISPLLSNYYLNGFDKFCVNNRYGYVRFADDFVLLCHTRDQAATALEEIRKYLLSKLNLRLNEGSSVKDVSEGFEFLGLVFKDTDRGITDKKLESLKSTIRRAVAKDRMQSADETAEALQGIDAYYGRILPQMFLEPLDQALFSALKEEARKRYADGEVKKQQIIELLNKVKFLSKTWQINRNREIKELLAYCQKRKKSEKRAEPQMGAASPRDPVARRKREYQKLEAAGFELVVSTPGTSIGSTRKGLVVKQRGTVIHQAPMNSLKHIFITAAGVSLSTNVISWAARNRIPIDFVEHSGEPYARLHPFHATDYKVQRAQLAAEDTGKATELAKTFVRGKIKNQMNLLKYYNKYRKTVDPEFVSAFEVKLQAMDKICDEIEGLEDAPHHIIRGKLFSIEGRAAAAYWDTVKPLLDEMIVFEGRIGQGAKDLVNSLLNYGYAILYGKIWNAVIKTGMTPYISFLHVPQAGKPTLVFDLIEEFRPQAVDRVVYSMINKRVELKMDGNLLSQETRSRLAEEVLERANTVEKFRGREMRLFEIINEQAANVAAYLQGDLPEYKPYVAKW